MSVGPTSLLRTAILDYGPIDALKALVWGGLKPSDLRSLELAFRALMTVDTVRVRPFVDGLGMTDSGVSWPPIDDAALDYEFEYDTGTLPPLIALSEVEAAGIRSLTESILSRAIGKIPQQFTAEDLLNYFPSKMKRVMGAVIADNLYPEINTMHLKDMLEEQLHTLVRFHRSGAVIFSDSPVAEICAEHLFPKFPATMFESLDEEWQTVIGKVIGPGIGVSVPPLTAVVLSRTGKRRDVALTIRELREEYQASRTDLWNRIVQMWTAPTLREQIRVLEDLEASSKSLFLAAFPQRSKFLQTALSVAVDLTEAKPLSALKELGQALLHGDADRSRVSAIGFTKQLCSDLRQIQGSDKFLRRLLSKDEQISFGLA